jgi:TetR/AcrR family fatty acid metabolism transcriptional regulator
VERIARHARHRGKGESDKRLALLKAAYEEVAETGFSEVTLEDIAERANVSKGITLYYFESKEALFRDLFRWVIEGIHRRMREAVWSAGDPLARLSALIDTIFASPALNRAFYAVYLDFSSLAARRESFRRENVLFYAGCADIDGAIIAEGVKQGIFPPQDVERSAMLIRALFDGLMMRWLAEEKPEETFPSYRERCRRAALEILGPKTPVERSEKP